MAETYRVFIQIEQESVDGNEFVDIDSHCVISTLNLHRCRELYDALVPVADVVASGNRQLTDTARVMNSYRRLYDGLSDMIESGRLDRVDIPDDYEWLIRAMLEIVASDPDRKPGGDDG